MSSLAVEEKGVPVAPRGETGRKTLVVTEKKSVADDFARVLGGFTKEKTRYEREDMVVAWASGHLLELQDPASYDDRFKRWALKELPIIPEAFVRVPRGDNARSKELLKGLVKQMKRKDVQVIVNACDAGREGELIFNLIADFAGATAPGSEKTIQRLWLQSMTAASIRASFEKLTSAASYRNLRDAAYARDEADWMVGMNGTRAFTKKFMGRARRFFAVGRVKTPTLAFLVDREREIDRFVPVPYFQIDATFDTGQGTYDGRWSGTNEEGRKADRLAKRESADAIMARLRAESPKRAFRDGDATERHTRRSEIPPLLFDLTAIQREASNRFGYTLDRTLSICQSLYEERKAITYPRTSSRYLPQDYQGETPKIISSLRGGNLGHVIAAGLAEVGTSPEELRPVKSDRVFNDARVKDHFALIPTGENPRTLKDDEARIYEMIVRRFMAVFLPIARWDNVTRETVVGGETFVTRERRLAEAGWRAVEPTPDLKVLAPLPPEGRVRTTEVEVLEKETQPPARFTDGTMVKAMETASSDLDLDDDKVDEETREQLKEHGIGTAATRAAIVKDLVQKDLARRQGRNILPTPLGCTLVRLVRNLDLGLLAKPDLTGDWEYRLAQMANGAYSRAEWDTAIKKQVAEMIATLKDSEGGNEEIFAVDHPGPLACPVCSAPLQEKTFSFMCSDTECELSIHKDQKGKYLFPETVQRLLEDGKVGPLTGFLGTRAPGIIHYRPDGSVEVEVETRGDDEEADAGADPTSARREEIPDGTVAGSCPKCRARGVKSEVTRQGTGYRCALNIARKKDKECDFRLAERIKYRYLPFDQIQRMLAGEKTEELFGFVSMRGRKFKASLSYDEKGELQWEFPPRKKKAAKKKASKKKAAKKKATKKSPPKAEED